jgi:hypothetical protein
MCSFLHVKKMTGSWQTRMICFCYCAN